MFVRRARAAVLAFAFAAGGLSPAGALTINLTEYTSGQALPLSRNSAVSAPNTTGTGTLAQVMRDAADYWERIIGDPGTLDVGFGWANLSSRTLGIATQYTNRDFTPRKRGEVRFNAQLNGQFYLDGDIDDDSDFGTLRTQTADLGGGTMSIGRRYDSISGPASGRFDLFSTAIHEIAHLLGFADMGDIGSTLRITQGPFDGATLRTTTVGGGHLDPDHFDYGLMRPTTNGQRILASDADLAGIAQFSDFTQVNYAAAVPSRNVIDDAPPLPAPVPLPAGALLLPLALFALFAAGRRRPGART